jgi:hypothetical protein
MKILMLLFILISGCSSNKLEERDNTKTIKRDYQVIDANLDKRPYWTDDVRTWEQANAKDLKQYKYFSFETEPKVSREIACNLAKANARSEIAAQITTFIKKELASSTEGKAAIDENNPKTKPLRDYVENTLSERVQALIYGAEPVTSYWEKRSYQKALGAKKDYYGYTCASLIKMKHSELKSSLKKARAGIAKSTDDTDLQEKVKQALNKIDEDFIQARKGEL